MLRRKGVLLVSTVNKEWPGFNPSPLSTRYFTAKELGELFESKGFHVKLYGAFPTTADSIKDRFISFARKTAVALHLIPQTMKGKAFLKRLFFGKLASIPPEVTEGMARLDSLTPIEPTVATPQYKVIYAIGQLP